MMPAAFRQPRSRVAIACSIALHCCGLALLAITWRAPTLFTLSDAPEAVMALPIRLEIRPRIPQPPARTIAARPLARIAPRRPRIIQTIVMSAAHVRRKSELTAAAASADDPDRTARQWAPTAANAQTATIAVETPDTLPTAAPPTTAATDAPTATPTEAPIGHGDGGLFGQNYPALPSPRNAFAAIRARIAGHFRIRVHVDETGHATAVSFLTPLGDAALRDDVRATLLALTYVPADCDGLRCADDVEIAR